jgi:hypothetical protein
VEPGGAAEGLLTTETKSWESKRAEGGVDEDEEESPVDVRRVWLLFIILVWYMSVQRS